MAVKSTLVNENLVALDANTINKNIERRYEGSMQEADKVQDRPQKRSFEEIKGDIKKLNAELGDEVGVSSINSKLSHSEASTIDSPTALLSSPIMQVTLATMLGIGILGCSIPIIKSIKKMFDASSEQRNQTDDYLSKKIEIYLKTDFKKAPWWRRPLWGEKTTLQKLIEPVYRKKVPDDVIFLHNRELESITPLAKKIEIIDSEKFTSIEFIEFLKIRQQLYSNAPPYENLENSFRLLNTAIEAKTCFEIIWQVEFRYLSSKQQECYRLVDELLAENLRGHEFQDPLKKKLEEVLPHIVSEEGQTAIRSYGEALTKLSSYEFGLDLLTLFKQYKMSDYVVLVTVDKILKQYQKEDLSNFRAALTLVMKSFDVLEQLAPIIQLPPDRALPETFARMLQFVAMLSKHQDSYLKFQHLISLLKQWLEPYEAIHKIRQDYGEEIYRKPKDFKKNIPGEVVYEKYHKWFSS